MIRSASAYHRRGAWIVGPHSQTESGLWVATPPYVQLPGTITYRELADATRVALSQSQTIPDINPRESPMPPSPILQAAGVKSWSTFYKGAKLVAVRSDDTHLTFSPTVNEGKRNGFGWLEDAKLSIPATASLAELGEALKKAIAACR